MAAQPPLAELLRKVFAGDPLSAEDENLLRQIARRIIGLPDSVVNSTGTYMTHWPGAPEEELYWCMLMEDHPGISVPGDLKCFDILVGTYCEDSCCHLFDCDSTDYEVGLDFHYGAVEPGAIACGWFKRLPCPWTDSNYIYHVVSLFCVENPPCSNYGLTDGECPTVGEDPCGA